MDKLASLLQLKIKVRYTLEYFKGPRKTRYPTSALCSISTITTLGWIWFYNFTRAPPARACPPPPRSLRNCVEVGGCDKGITNTEREGPPTMRCPPTGTMQCPCWPAATWRDGMGPTARYLAPLPPPTCDRGITGTASSLSMIGYQMQVYDV